MTAFPTVALSVRQPWAWAIIHGGKDVENRSPYAVGVGKMKAMIGRRIAIHASRGMGQGEYKAAAFFLHQRGVDCPLARTLKYGGIIGTVTLKAIVQSSTSPWYMGHGANALILAEPEPCEFIPAIGQLGMFNWARDDEYVMPEMPKWMIMEGRDTVPVRPEQQEFFH